jgi:hypothetical protein
MPRVGVLLLVVACGSQTAPPDAGLPPQYRLDRPCLSGVVGGPLVPSAWDELFVAHGCVGQFGETVQYGPGIFGVSQCCDFIFHFELIGVTGPSVVAIHESRRELMLFGPGFRSVRFAHVFDDIAILDFDGDAAPDYVVAGDGAIRRAPVTNRNFVEAVEEIELLSGKPYRFVAVADLGGSALLDLFYITGDGEIGIAIQVAPDAFFEQVLAQDRGAPRRLVVADVDGDGRDDIVGAAGHLFVRSSKTGAFAMLDEPVHAIGVGDFNADGIGEPVFVTADRAAVRRVVIAENGALASEPLIEHGGDAMAIADLDGDRRSDIALVHDLNAASSWLYLHRAFTF